MGFGVEVVLFLVISNPAPTRPSEAREARLSSVRHHPPGGAAAAPPTPHAGDDGRGLQRGRRSVQRLRERR